MLNRNKNINRGFRKLDIWKVAIDLYQFIHATLSRAKEIPFKVKAQIEDSALSVSSNIAEGYTRRNLKENIRFYEIALSSAGENYSQMFALRNASQIDGDTFDEFDGRIFELENKLLKMIKDMILKLKTNADWRTDYE